jgi:gluconolactonase
MAKIATTGIFEIHDHRFRQLIVGSAGLDTIATGLRWAEGPVWFADRNCLLFSDIPNQRILQWTAAGVGVFREPSNFANGHSRDRQGRLISCEHGTRRVTRTEIDGSLSVLADSHQGKRLNSPNDLVCSSDGAIWFTDPSYGILSDYEGYRGPQEQAGRFVYRLDPSGTLRVVAEDFRQPNGLAFSPDEKTLYIADSAASHDPALPRVIRAFDVAEGHLSQGRVFAEIDAGIPDGIRVDIFGNLWSSAADGVHCFAPDGVLLGKVLVPQVVSNLCFGGPRKNRLFITATTSVYAIYLATTGAQTP